MKSKFTLLILVSALALIALCAIQAYLIGNTYELKKEAFMNEADEAVSEVANDRALDSIYDILIDEELENHLADYLNQRITKRQALDRIFRTADAFNTDYLTLYKARVEDMNLGYPLRFQYNLVSIGVIDYPDIDTIYYNNESGRSRLFGEPFENGESRRIDLSRTYDTNQYIEQRGDSIFTNTYDFELRMEQRIQIPNWKTIVLKRMWVLILGSILLFLFVIGLLYYSIKNLITQKKIAEVKTDFINNVTHELKTPLATLAIATKSLRNDTIRDTPDAFDATLSIVERQNTRLQKLIDQVLTKSLKAEELILHKEQVLDNHFFRDLIADFEIATQHSDLIIVNEIYKPEILLRIDRFHLTTALLNILENAVKYGKDKVRIIVKSTLQQGHYVIEISDNGIGILPKDQNNVFEKFYRAQSGNIHNVKGLGLGLYLTHQIITAHGGSIYLNSTEEDGTTFRIIIPIS